MALVTVLGKLIIKGSELLFDDNKNNAIITQQGVGCTLPYLIPAMLGAKLNDPRCVDWVSKVQRP
jgi:hypothetical protein